MTDTMLAAIVTKFGAPLDIQQVARPKPDLGQILIKLQASGVCHTDVHVWLGHSRPPILPTPFVLGHEGVGIVTEVGAGVTDWQIGERAGAAWTHSTCGSCAECNEGEENFCQEQVANGFNVPGTFAHYVIADSRFAVKLPQGDAAPLAPIMCAGLTAYGAIRRSELKAGETCIIFGCGGLGLYAIQLASRLGAHVVAVDLDDAKLALAQSLGAKTIVNSSSLRGIGWPIDIRAHVCINFAPTPHTWPHMIAAILPRGRIIAAAMVAQPVPVEQEWLTYAGVRITGTSVGTRKQLRELLAIHSQSPLFCEIERIRLEDATEALEALKYGTAKGRFCIEY